MIERKTGGAYTALKYAQKLGKKIINLANKIDQGTFKVNYINSDRT